MAACWDPNVEVPSYSTYNGCWDPDIWTYSVHIFPRTLRMSSFCLSVCLPLSVRVPLHACPSCHALSVSLSLSLPRGWRPPFFSPVAFAHRGLRLRGVQKALGPSYGRKTGVFSPYHNNRPKHPNVYAVSMACVLRIFDSGFGKIPWCRALGPLVPETVKEVRNCLRRSGTAE